MAITYEWTISELMRYPQQNGYSDVVYAIRWRRFATDGVSAADDNGLQEIAFAPESSFTDFLDLTQDQVTQWLENALGTERIAELDANLSRQINNQKLPVLNPPVLPWATS